MTYRSETPEIRLLKNLKYNHYTDIGIFPYIDDDTTSIFFELKPKPQPFVEAFLTSKERFSLEIEIMTVERGEDNKPIDLIPVRQIIQVTGLGLPSPGDDTQPEEDSITLKFVDFKVIEGTNQYGEYWSDDVADYEQIQPFERSVVVEVNKMGLNGVLQGGAYEASSDPDFPGIPNTFWANTLPGQVLDIACYIP